MSVLIITTLNLWSDSVWTSPWHWRPSQSPCVIFTVTLCGPCIDLSALTMTFSSFPMTLYSRHNDSLRLTLCFLYDLTMTSCALIVPWVLIVVLCDHTITLSDLKETVCPLHNDFPYCHNDLFALIMTVCSIHNVFVGLLGWLWVSFIWVFVPSQWLFVTFTMSLCGCNNDLHPTTMTCTPYHGYFHSLQWLCYPPNKVAGS